MDQTSKRETQKRRRRIPDLRGSVVYIGNLSGRIQHENNILRMIQNALVEIALAAKRRPGNFLVGDVENQPTILD